MSHHVAHCGTHNGEACDCASDYDCSPVDCDCRAPTVPDTVADTARALAERWRALDDTYDSYWRSGMYDHAARLAKARRDQVADAARACGPQVESAFRALVTGDARREVGA